MTDKIYSPIKKRIVEYLDNKGFSKKDFFDKTGISASNFKGKGMGSEIGGDKIVKILSFYPDINTTWLLTGKGGMISGGVNMKTSIEPHEVEKCKSCEDKDQTIDDLREMIRSQRSIINLLEDKIEDLRGGDHAQIA